MANTKPRYVVHSHYAKPLDITDRVIAGAWSRSTMPPYDSASFMFKLSAKEIGTLINVGDWVVVHDPTGVAYSFSYVEKVNYTTEADNKGGVSLKGSASCISWAQLMAKPTIYVPLGGVESVGTIYNTTDWAQVVFFFANEYIASDPLGRALQKFHSRVATIKLPDSLGGGTIGSDIPVVYDDETVALYAPNRVIDPIVTSSGSIGMTGANFFTTSAYEHYYRMWVPEPAMIELYPSLEPIGGSADPSPLAAVLNARPVLVYTLKPWRSEPLEISQTTNPAMIARDSIVNGMRGALQPSGLSASGQVAGAAVRGILASGGTSNTERQVQPVTTELDTPVADRPLYSAADIYSRITRDPVLMKIIPTDAVRGLELGYSDSERINVTTISLAPGNVNGIEALKNTGLPIINKQAVINHGARVFKPKWNFMPAIFSKDQYTGTVNDYLYAVAAQAMQFYANNHRLATGTLVTDPLDSTVVSRSSKESTVFNDHRYVDLNAGEWFRVKLRPGLDEFSGYVIGMQTSWSAAPNGSVAMKTTISFCRGSALSDESVTFGKVPVDRKGSPSSPAPSPPREVTRRAQAKSGSPQQADDAPVAASGIMVNGNEYAYVSGVRAYRHFFKFGDNYKGLVKPRLLSSNELDNPAWKLSDGSNGHKINTAIIHTNDGSLSATAASLRTYFQNRINNYDPVAYEAARAANLKYQYEPANTHFCIDTDGTIFQYMDITYVAWHSGVYDTNFSGIAIDLIVPKYSISREAAKTFDGALKLLARGWTAREGWSITPAGMDSSKARVIPTFYGATPAQEVALAKLLATIATHFVFPLEHDTLGRSSYKNVVRMTASDIQSFFNANSGPGGVYHHLQVLYNRTDTLGTDLAAIVELAKKYKGT